MIQDKALKNILDHASNNIAYYRNLGIKPNSADPHRWLSDFPVVDKTVIARNEDNLISGSKEKLTKILTSGSSGVQGFSYLDNKALSINRAIQIFWWEKAGYSLGKRTMQFGVDQKRSKFKWAKDFLLRIHYVPAFGNDEKNIKQQLDSIRNNGIRFVAGYASSLFLLAAQARKHNLKMPKLDGVVSWGEKLFPHFEEELRNVFSCDVLDTYGSSEGLSMGYRCSKRKYHIMEPHVYLELVDNNYRPTQSGEIGRLLVTRLDNYAFPLIRYALGDLAIMDHSQGPCSCGSPYKYLDQVVGRETDLIELAPGETITVQQVVYFMKHIKGLDEYQVIQKEKNQLVIRYMRDEVFSDQERIEVVSEFNSQVSTPFNIEFEKVESIPATLSGKRQLIKIEQPT